MHLRTSDLPVSMDVAGARMQNIEWGAMVINYVELPAGADLSPMLEGLPGDKCQCPHWGYVLKGAVNLRYSDGSEEKTSAGEVFYWPSGHTGWVKEDTVFMDFSPAEEFKVLAEHLAKKTAQAQ
ncbi:MAG: hypothetical protein KDD85_11485 [Parvularculaceae bacterium]|nr:hypothetical protein [Parvularculaceae bacterium]